MEKEETYARKGKGGSVNGGYAVEDTQDATPVVGRRTAKGGYCQGIAE